MQAAIKAFLHRFLLRLKRAAAPRNDPPRGDSGQDGAPPVFFL
jgi:hypothetical protein